MSEVSEKEQCATGSCIVSNDLPKHSASSASSCLTEFVRKYAAEQTMDSYSASCHSFATPSIDDARNIARMVQKLTDFLSASGSTDSIVPSDLGMTMMKQASTATIMERVLHRPTSHIVANYNDLFVANKDSIHEHFETSSGKEGIYSMVHHCLNLIVKMTNEKKTSKSSGFNYCLKYEIQVDADTTDLDTTSHESRPTLDIRVLASHVDAKNLNYLTNIFCCEANLNPNYGMLWALHCLAQKILTQIELFRNIHDRYFGVCFTTDGRSVYAGHISVENQVCCIEGDTGIPIANLWCDAWDKIHTPVDLHSVEGFVHLLTALDCSPAELGLKSDNNLYGITGCRSIGLLGVGSFSSCVEVEWKHRRYAIKAPRYTASIDDQSCTVMRLSHEMKTVQLLQSSDKPYRIYFPKISDSFTKVINSNRCIVFKTVGISLQSAIISEGWQDITVRRAKAASISSALTDALSYVHIKFKICHCDIAPSNILLTRRKGCDGALTPLLVDWELAATIGTNYHSFRGRRNIMHKDLVKHILSGSSQPIPVRTDYDHAALHYSMACFVYNSGNMNVPWSDWIVGADPRAFHYWRDRIIAELNEKRWTEDTIREESRRPEVQAAIKAYVV